MSPDIAYMDPMGNGIIIHNCGLIFDEWDDYIIMGVAGILIDHYMDWIIPENSRSVSAPVRFHSRSMVD